MTQEDKDLLLIYLSMALPYGVKVQVYYEDIAGSGYFDDTVWSIDNDEPFHANDIWIENIKPYLRSMLSMTKEEKEEMHNLLSPEGTAIYENDGIALPINQYGEFVPYEFMNRVIQYLLKKHFDFMGLIPKGLAIEVTETNNPYK